MWLPAVVPKSACEMLRLLAKSYCGTCPRSRFLGSFTDHFDGLPTNRQSGFVNSPVTEDEFSLRRWHEASTSNGPSCARNACLELCEQPAPEFFLCEPA